MKGADDTVVWKERRVDVACSSEVLMHVRVVVSVCSVVLAVTSSVAAQQMPGTGGETLNGKRVISAELVRGHETILVAGFSHDAGVQCGPWMKAIERDSALKDATAYELAMLEKAPGMVRGMIKSGMRKGTTPEERDHIVVMTQDQKEWEKFFDVKDRKDPYLLVLDGNGRVVWHGHGPAALLEPQLRSAIKK